MIKVYLRAMAHRYQIRRLGSSLLVVAELLVWNVKFARAEEVVASRTRLVAQTGDVNGSMSDNRAKSDESYATAESLKRSAIEYMRENKCAESLHAMEEAVRIYRGLASKSDQYLGDLGREIENHGVFYSMCGRPAEALRSSLESVAVFRRLVADDSNKHTYHLVDLAHSLIKLAIRYRLLGRAAEALPLSAESARIFRNEGAKYQHVNLDFELAFSLAHMSNDYSELGRFEEALVPLLEAIAIFRRLASENASSRYLLSYALQRLGFVLGELGRLDEAIPPSEESVALMRRIGIRNPSQLVDLAGSISNLGHLYRQVHLLNKARPLLEEAAKILRPLSSSNPDILLGLVGSSYELGDVLLVQGYTNEAAALIHEAVSGETLYLQRVIALIPEGNRQLILAKTGSRWHRSFSLAGQNAAGTYLALFTRLNRHGLLQQIEQRQALLSRAPGFQTKRVQQIASLTTRLSDMNLPPAQQQALQKQREELEEQLLRDLPELKPSLVKPEVIAMALPADGVLVEFQRYQSYDGIQKPAQRWGGVRYLALVLTPDSSIRAVDLGAAAAIDPLIAQALAASEKAGQDPEPLWNQVRQQIFSPLMPFLTNRKHWFLSPDGELNRVPFPALLGPEKTGSLLAQTVQLRLLTSGRDLLPQIGTNQTKADQILVIANPDFGAPGTPWKPLPATAKEGRQIAFQLRGTLLEGAQATAKTLQQVRGLKVLHVASHGFFSNPQTSPQTTTITQGSGPRSAAISGPPATTGDPLLNSGIVLAGANSHIRFALKSSAQDPAAAYQDDGYLTAKEVARMQLEGTELVVLSACETASGSFQSGEGVYGLQRALTVAGAHSTLLSLWKVDDDATAFFMERYYSLLKKGKGRMEALLAVQNEFRTNPKIPAWEDFHYWAAFQLVGESGPINGL